MRAAVLLVAASLASACTRSPFGGEPRPDAGADSLYWKAIASVHPASAERALDSGIVYLDRYLATPGPLRHGSEAQVLRRLAVEAQQLARVEAALQARTDSAESRPQRSSSEPTPRRDEAAIREIQRLKEELAKANEELERIRKRLAAPPSPKPPG